MATNEQRARRRAQRENKKRVDAALKGNRYKPVLPRVIRASSRTARENYAYGVIDGTIPYPKMGTKEAKNLAGLASLASWDKAPAIFEAKFSKLWYHKENEKDVSDADTESSPDSADNEED